MKMYAPEELDRRGWPIDDPVERMLDDLSAQTATVAVITGDKPDDRCITLGPGDGTFQRWKLSESLLKKIRREINEKLD